MEFVQTLKDFLGITNNQYDLFIIIFALWFLAYFAKSLFALFGVMLHWK